MIQAGKEIQGGFKGQQQQFARIIRALSKHKDPVAPHGVWKAYNQRMGHCSLETYGSSPAAIWCVTRNFLPGMA